MSNENAWIWFQHALGFTPNIYEIFTQYENAVQLLNAGEREWRISGLFTPKQIDKMIGAEKNYSEILRLCEKNHISIITPDSCAYPQNLLKTNNYPAVLYCRGDLSFVNESLSIAVVGTRDASPYGRKAAALLCASLAKIGVVIVSGGALGIDDEAHRAALKENGKTVLVMGCGLLYDYLREQNELRREIVKSGAIISEFPPNYPPGRSTFPIRNRIISGICRGTVVIEAAERSGSLITARLANEQGRDVFVVPGSIISSSFTGANKLMRDGAKPVFTAMDILDEYLTQETDAAPLRQANKPVNEDYDYLFENLPKDIVPEIERPRGGTKAIVKETKKSSAPLVKAVRKDLPLNVSDIIKAVYSLISFDPIKVEQLVEKSDFSLREIQNALMQLEMDDFIKAAAGRSYVLAGDIK